MDRPQRVAIVTGAGSGIGAAIAARLARSGAAVVLVGRRRERVEATRAEIVAAGGQAMIAVEDIADPASPRRIVDNALEGWGRVDVIVNNAAYIRNLTLAEITAAQFDLHFATNLRGPMLLIQAALPALQASDSASVINISSSSASLSIPSQAMYASTKAGLEFCTKLLAAELAPSGIRVNCIAPGPTNTEIHLLWARDLATARVALRDAVPLGRIADPTEIARWVDYLARADEHFITGAVIAVDGGQTLNGWRSSIGDAAASAASGEAAPAS